MSSSTYPCPQGNLLPEIITAEVVGKSPSQRTGWFKQLPSVKPWCTWSPQNEQRQGREWVCGRSTFKTWATGNTIRISLRWPGRTIGHRENSAGCRERLYGHALMTSSQNVPGPRTAGPPAHAAAAHCQRAGPAAGTERQHGLWKEQGWGFISL